VLFTGSIADNISFFDEHPDKDWMIQCAKAACIHAEIMALPMAYASLVGDMGTALSGGQKQRVVLARALYKRPSLLLLDEATSHLDAEREMEISRAIGLMKITKIMVAHRAETIRTADRVLVLSRGSIANDRLLEDRREETVATHLEPRGGEVVV
jgi:ATP-binding cassette, subfamily B, bacterial CvaB/MchF/RaxB